jgi:hypothetical protein
MNTQIERSTIISNLVEIFNDCFNDNYKPAYTDTPENIAQFVENSKSFFQNEDNFFEEDLVFYFFGFELPDDDKLDEFKETEEWKKIAGMYYKCCFESWLYFENLRARGELVGYFN